MNSFRLFLTWWTVLHSSLSVTGFNSSDQLVSKCCCVSVCRGFAVGFHHTGSFRPLAFTAQWPWGTTFESAALIMCCYHSFYSYSCWILSVACVVSEANFTQTTCSHTRMYLHARGFVLPHRLWTFLLFCSARLNLFLFIIRPTEWWLFI